MNGKSVLLIGGTGTLSYATLQESLDKGFFVTVFNRGNNNGILPKEIKILNGNFYDEASLRTSLGNMRFDVIVDFLSRKPADIKRVYPLVGNRCKQYIFISSACVYDRQPAKIPIRESSPKPNKDWDYSINKYDCEMLLETLHKDYSSCFTIVRPYITYNNRRVPFGVAPKYKYHRTIIERIINEKPLFVWDPDSLCTITHTSDFALGLVGLFLNEKAQNEVFHITSDYCYKTHEILNEMYRQLGKKPNIIKLKRSALCKYLPNYMPMMIGDRFLDAVFDNSKIKDAVPSLRFNINLQRGISQIIEYYRLLQSYDYDYQYEGQIDRMLEEVGGSCKYIRYKMTKGNSWLTYHIYKAFPYKIANKLARIFNVK